MTPKKAAFIVFLCVLALFCNVPALTVLIEGNYNVSFQNGFNLNVWVLIATAATDAAIIQFFFFFNTWPIGATFFMLNIHKILTIISIPTYALLVFSSAVLTDLRLISYDSKQNGWTIYLYIQTKILSYIYGNYVIILSAMTLVGYFSSIRRRRLFALSCTAFICALIGVCLWISLGNGKIAEDATIWAALTGTYLILFTVAIYVNQIFTPSDWKIFANFLRFGFGMALLLTYGSFTSLGDSSLKVMNPLNRYGLLSLSRLLGWPISFVLFALICGLILVILIKCGVIGTQSKLTVPGIEQELLEVILEEGDARASAGKLKSVKGEVDLENPMEIAQNPEIGLLKKAKKTDLNEEDCPICWESFEVGQKLYQTKICKHYFHQACLKTWCNKDSRCPICRTGIKKPTDPMDVVPMQNNNHHQAQA